MERVRKQRDIDILNLHMDGHSIRKLSRDFKLRREVIRQIVGGSGSIGPRATVSAVPVKCPTCGGKVYLPCRLCHVRELQKKGPIEKVIFG